MLLTVVKKRFFIAGEALFVLLQVPFQNYSSSAFSFPITLI